MADVITGRSRSDLTSERQQIEDIAARNPQRSAYALARDIAATHGATRTFYSALSVIRRFRAKQAAAVQAIGA